MRLERVAARTQYAKAAQVPNGVGKDGREFVNPVRCHRPSARNVGVLVQILGDDVREPNVRLVSRVRAFPLTQCLNQEINSFTLIWHPRDRFVSVPHTLSSPYALEAPISELFDSRGGEQGPCTRKCS